MIPQARVGLLQISLAGVLWGTGGLAVEVVRDHAPLSTLTISGYRTGIAALVLLGTAAALRRLGDVRSLLRSDPVRVALVGLTTAAYQAFYFASVVLVGVTVSTVVSLGLAPVLLVARDAVVARSRPAGVGAVAAALLGLVLVSGTAGLGETGPSPVLGVLAALASGTAYAVATALGEPLARRADPLALTTATTLVGAVALLPVALLLGGPAGTSDPVALATLVYLGALTFALAYALLYAGLRTTTSSAAVVATLLEPVTAGLVATVFLGERLGPLGVLGMVLVLLAVASLGRPAVPRPSGARWRESAAARRARPPRVGDVEEIVAVWLGALDGTTWWEQQADEPVYAASLLKVPLATAAEAIDLTRRVPVHTDFDSAAGGRFTIEREDDQDDATWDARGRTETLLELRRRAIVDSSNIATNLLLEQVGVAAVQAVLDAAGVSGRTTFTRGIGDVAARDAGLANDVTARDLGRVLAQTPAAVEAVMLEQRYRDGIPAGLPPGTHVANKTGWVDGITHDMAIVRPSVDQGGAPFVLVVLTRTDQPHEVAEARVAALAAEAWRRRR